MNTALEGHLFGGDTLQVSPVSVMTDADQLVIRGENLLSQYALQDVRVSDRIGRIPRYLYLPDGRTVETLDNDAVDSWLAARRRGREAGVIHWLEQRSRVAAAATLVLVASLSALVFFGLPVMARRAAFLVPVSIEKKAGEAAMNSIRGILQPSSLSLDDRVRVAHQLERLVSARRLHPKPKLEFRSMGGENPNAFALPGGYLVMTDELVNLASDDDELAAVLAHEIGHSVHRHGLQGVFRSSAALLVVSTMTGDLSALTTFSSTIPYVLLQRGYSREFEAEADQYAIDLLLDARIDPHALAQILAALEEEHKGGRQDYSYLSTHPSTDERIRAIDSHQRTFPPEAGAVPRKTAARRPAVTKLRLPAESEEPVDLGTEGIPPKAISLVNPEYPVDLRRADIEGSVVVEYIVDRHGDVQATQVISSTHKDFEAPAMAAVAQWKFVPGRKGGRDVATRVQQTVTFNLRDDDPDDDTPESPAPKIEPLAPVPKEVITLPKF